MAPRTSKPPLTGAAQKLPFDSLSPDDFERLCLWLVDAESYTGGEHLGQAGSDQGRDDAPLKHEAGLRPLILKPARRQRSQAALRATESATLELQAG
jgi:hypothetical protein